jgi:uncharacterized surface protein with fasciclin (FAS1) repeats
MSNSTIVDTLAEARRKIAAATSNSGVEVEALGGLTSYVPTLDAFEKLSDATKLLLELVEKLALERN